MVDKKVKLYWLVASFILIVGIHWLDGVPAIDDWLGFILGAFFGALLLIIVSIILAVIIAAYPFNTTETPGKERVRQYIPIATIMLTFISIIAFVFSYGF